MDREKIVVAEIIRPWGNRGEVLIRSLTDVPSRLENLKQAHAALRDGSEETVEIEGVRAHKEAWVVKLGGIDSIEAAERFRAADLWVPLGERGSLPDGEFFQTDLIGCAVVDQATGRQLGEVEGWQEYGGPPLMQVRSGEREILIPFVDSIYREVDLAGRRISVDLPEGLLEL